MARLPEAVGAFGDDYMDGDSGHDDMYGQLGHDMMLGSEGEDAMAGDRGLITNNLLGDGDDDPPELDMLSAAFSDRVEGTEIRIRHNHGRVDKSDVAELVSVANDLLGDGGGVPSPLDLVIVKIHDEHNDDGGHHHGELGHLVFLDDYSHRGGGGDLDALIIGFDNEDELVSAAGGLVGADDNPGVLIIVYSHDHGDDDHHGHGDGDDHDHLARINVATLGVVADSLQVDDADDLGVLIMVAGGNDKHPKVDKLDSFVERPV